MKVMATDARMMMIPSSTAAQMSYFTGRAALLRYTMSSSVRRTVPLSVTRVPPVRTA